VVDYEAEALELIAIPADAHHVRTRTGQFAGYFVEDPEG
jgi:hypothetical protein